MVLVDFSGPGGENLLTEEQIEILKTKPTEEQFNFLVSLKGIGEKVANCIMLFGLGVKNVFPVDTWINKVYNKLNNTTETNRKKITKELARIIGGTNITETTLRSAEEMLRT